MLRNARVLIAMVISVAALAAAPGVASAWAPAGSATIHPGVQTVTSGGQCTANFIFTAGGDTYIGQAAHCSGTGAATDTDGCDSGSLPLGTPVEVSGATQPGTLVYNSWIPMQQSGESNADLCAFIVLTLWKLGPAHAAAVNPGERGCGGR